MDTFTLEGRAAGGGRGARGAAAEELVELTPTLARAGGRKQRDSCRRAAAAIKKVRSTIHVPTQLRSPRRQQGTRCDRSPEMTTLKPVPNSVA
jgi:hypothetical protein